ncbi:MAG: TetR/AcrR family transcriptional regulator [Oscillospiraceae bacterium]
MTTEERIINSAVSLFSRKGYKNTSIKEIARKADVNSLTVFRYFHDKDTLFFQAVEQMKKSVFDPEKLNGQLTFQDVPADLMAMGRAYLDEIYANLPLIRIYIGEGLNFEQLNEERWFISPVLREHFSSYIGKLDGAGPLAKEHADLLAEMFVSYITRKVMAGSKYQDVWEKTPAIEAEFEQDFPPQARYMASMITGHPAN